MQHVKLITVIIIAIIAVVALYFYFRTTTSAEIREHTYGPFTIRMEKFTSSNFNVNYGMVKHTHIAYSVWFDGKIVPYPSELQNNTGFSHLWRVYIVRDAPHPTLFAGSQSLFKITAINGSYEVVPVEIQSTDFIKFQWLDAVNGQPGPAFELYMANEQTSMDHPDTLQGGNYLMINQKHVIHIPTMEQFSFNKGSEYVDNYDKTGDALAFSPDERVITFPGSFQTWNSEERPKYHHALVSFDFRKDVIRVLPYSKNDTRLYRHEDLNQEWFERHFMWDTVGDETVLKLKKTDKPALWQGYFKENSFYLYPTDEAMLEIFKQFVLDYMKWSSKAVLTESYHEYTGKVYQLGTEKSLFYLVGRESEIHLSPDLYEKTEDSTLVLIREIGQSFNELLKTGKYQEHFTSIPEYDTY